MQRRNLLIHLGSWLGVYLLAVVIISEMLGFERALTRPLHFIAWLAIIFYWHLYVLLPHLLGKGKRNAYIAALLGTVGIGLLLGFFSQELIDTAFPPETAREIELEKLRSSFSAWGRQLPPVVLALALSGLVWNSQLLRRRKQESIELRNRVLEAESMALKNQINPHFLFNTLNNIYSLTQIESEQTGDAVLKLSDILRYVIYESNSRYVNLADELNYIESYFQLQLLKDDTIDSVKLHLPEHPPRLCIAPLLLIPFIENSFKHSKFEDTANGWIDTNITLQGNMLVLVNRNSVPQHHTQKDAVGGVGLENVQQRLALLYPDAHQLTINKTDTEFSVRLELQLHEPELPGC